MDSIFLQEEEEFKKKTKEKEELDRKIAEELMNKEKQVF